MTGSKSIFGDSRPKIKVFGLTQAHTLARRKPFTGRLGKDDRVEYNKGNNTFILNPAHIFPYGRFNAVFHIAGMGESCSPWDNAAQSILTEEVLGYVATNNLAAQLIREVTSMQKLATMQWILMIGLGILAVVLWWKTGQLEDQNTLLQVTLDSVKSKVDVLVPVAPTPTETVGPPGRDV